jgi:hypothetical protein
VQRDVDHVRGQPDELARGQGRAGLRLGDHAPAEPEADGRVEVGTGRDVVDDRRALGHPATAEHLVLQLVLAVEDDDRHRGPAGRAVPLPPGGERRGGGGQVAKRPEPVDAAALHGGRVAGDRRQHIAAAQQLLGVALVVDEQPDCRPGPGGRLGQHIAEPGGQGVGVDRHRELHDGARRQGLGRLVVQEPGLPPKPDEPHPVPGGTARRAPADQDLAGRRLERADALADRARRDVQLPGRRLERTVIGDGDERVELSRVKVHQASEAQLMDTKKHSFAFIWAQA